MSDDPRIDLDALAAACGLDVERGFQVAGGEAAARLDPTRPALLHLDPAGRVPAEALRGYPAETEARPVIRRDGAFHCERTTIGRLEIPADAVALALPAVPAEQVRLDFRGLRGVIARVRAPDGGCPWDLEQDHRSLRPHLLEEAYETLLALDGDDAAALQEELGDLLMQIVLHAQIAEDRGAFDIDDVCEGIRAKLVRRHPHVFGDVTAESAEAVVANWDRLKAEEREAEASALEGVPVALAALARANSLAGRAARRGFDPGKGDTAPEGVGDAAELGDLLFGIVDAARRQGIEAEDALREACTRFERRFRALEASLREGGLEMRNLDAADLRRRWEAVEEG